MAKITVGIGEAAVSRSPDDEIITHALGSCVAIVVLDPITRSGGMVHVALPESNTDSDKAKKLPGYFADTGFEHLLRLMSNVGVNDQSKFIVKLAGGANVTQISQNDLFEIGKRNVVAIRKLLWQAGLPIKAEDVGGTNSRTVRLNMSDGQVLVMSHAYEGPRRL